jgi:2'-5' RNA ligase
MAKRIFLGIPVPESIQHSLAIYTQTIAADSLRFTKPENYHITVSFFGEQEEERIPEISQAITTVLHSIAPFTISFDAISFAPPKREPSMIWALYTQIAPFTNLVDEIEEAVRKVLPYADKRNGHVPLPHITLARFRHTPLQTLPQIQLDPIQVEKLSLYESKRTEAGLSYVILEEYSLQETNL